MKQTTPEARTLEEKLDLLACLALDQQKRLDEQQVAIVYLRDTLEAALK